MPSGNLKRALLIALAASTVLVAPRCVAAEDSNQSQLEANKKIAQQYFSELIEKEDPSYVDKLFDENAEVQFGPSWKSTVTGNNKISGLPNLKRHFAHIHATKDITSETIDVVAEGDRVAIYRMTHEKFPDGTTADVPWMSFFKIKNGKVVSVHHVHDSLSQEQQHAVTNKNTPSATQ